MYRVLTLNVWNLSRWSERRDEVVAWMDRLDPDVVCLQEIIQSPDGRNQAVVLADACARDWHVAYAGRPHRHIPDRLFGNAILSRVPIAASSDIDLPYEDRDDDVQRVVVHARCGDVDVYSTHLNWRFDDGHVRERQVVALADFVGATAAADAPLPPIIGGDFNATPSSTEIRFLTGETSAGGRSVYFQDAWRVAGGDGPGLTWDNRNPFAAVAHEPDRRIDYVFVGWRRDTGAGRVEHARVVCDRSLTGSLASDHFGIYAEIAT